MRRYVWRDLVHNPRRTIASLVGVALGVGLFAGLLFFMDGSGATLTARAIAPLTLDMQRVLTSSSGGGLRLTEELTPSGALGAGDEATITLIVRNAGTAAANEVVVTDVPPPPLTYVPGTSTRDGEPIPDVEGESPLSHGLAGFGLNLGRVDPGAQVSISYVARAEGSVDDVGSLAVGGTVSSREQVEPSPANAPPVLTLDELRRAVSTIPGVAAADGLGLVDLPPGSLAAGGSTISDPVRIFAFDRAYQAHYPSIRLVAGGFAPGSAFLSVEAARALAATPGDPVELRIPGLGRPLSLTVSGLVDLARAAPLFSSRKSSKLEEFLYVPNSIVVTPETFRDEIVPAFDRARASVGSIIKSFPLLELDVLIDRSQLRADPGTALEQTERIAGAIERIAPGQDFLIDNISNTLAVARDDAAAGKRMFLFLGLPGVVLAAFVAAYAGGILAAAERREHAILRVRGAHRGHLRKIAFLKASAFAAAGSILGIALGLGSAVAVLGWATFSEADPGDLALSAFVAVVVGAVTTALALYIPARRSVSREVSQERHEMQVAQVPAWRRMWLDLALLAVAALAGVFAVRTGVLDPPSGSVYAGIAVSPPSRLMLAPLLAWVGGSLLCVRALEAVASRLPEPHSSRFGPVVGGVLRRSIRRRSWGLATGIVGLGLVVGFGTSLAIFAATYDAAKAADARFVVGADLRITPSAQSTRAHRPRFASELAVPGMTAVSPVVFRLENSVLIGPFNQNRKNLAAIDPASFAQVAPDSVDGPALDTTRALGNDPRGALVDVETADDLQVETGDTVEIVLALGTDRETREPFTVVGLFERFPGFPEGANLVVNLDAYAAVTRQEAVDFFLADVVGDEPASLDRAVAALESGPGESEAIHVESTATALAKDQSSLTALNVNGLVRLDWLYVLLMSAATIAIFVFGLMLQRRREYVTLRAQGLGIRELQALVLGEAALVALCGLTAGLVVGSGIAIVMVGILRALFVLDPVVTFPAGAIAMQAALVLAATVVSGLTATEVLRRLAPTEILREE